MCHLLFFFFFVVIVLKFADALSGHWQQTMLLDPMAIYQSSPVLGYRLLESTRMLEPIAR